MATTFTMNLKIMVMKWTATSGTPTCGTSGMCVTYDAFGRIVETSNNLAWRTRWITQLGETANMNGTTINFAYWPEPEGGTTVITGNSGAFYHLHSDWLGNARVASTITGHAITTDQAYSPYGEVYDTFGSTNSYFDVFAGTTSNLANGIVWDTPNRELSVVGRWLSPDPAGSGWNQYAYPTNPNSSTDPSGLYAQIPGSIYTSHIDPYVAGASQATCNVDGLDEPCQMVYDDSAVQCPSNICSGFNSDGEYVQFMAGAGGAQGYVSFNDGVHGLNEWGGAFYTNSQFQILINQMVEMQKEARADAISNASTSPDGSNWDDIYNGISAELDGNGNPIVYGGHAVFSLNLASATGDGVLAALNSFIPAKDWNTPLGGCTISCRYGSLDAIHFNNGDFHLDTVGVNWGFGLGALLHGLIDYGSGNINPSVPMLP